MEKTLNKKIQDVPAWFAVNGDNTHSLNHEINEESVIMDLGGFTGVWINKMINKYNPNVYAIEPIGRFYNIMVDKFKSNPKVRLLNVGISDENKKDKIFLKGDETSSQNVGGESIDVEFITMEKLLETWNLDKVDLLQINIEGDEYPLLRHMLETGTINKFSNIQIQFHMDRDGFVKQREEIRKGLENNNFKLKYDFPFVWECWTKNG